MKKINVWYFYKLAQTIEPLKYLNHKDHWNRLYMSCMLAHLTLDKLDSETVEVPLKRCRPEAQQLQNAMRPIISSQQERTDLEPADIVAIHFAAEKFETVLAMELREIDVFYVPPIAIFSTSALLNDPEAIFFERAKLLPEEVITEIKEAGKALAFALATAAGFHLMRYRINAAQVL